MVSLLERRGERLFFLISLFSVQRCTHYFVCAWTVSTTECARKYIYTFFQGLGRILISVMYDIVVFCRYSEQYPISL